MAYMSFKISLLDLQSLTNIVHIQGHKVQSKFHDREFSTPIKVFGPKQRIDFLEAGEIITIIIILHGRLMILRSDIYGGRSYG